MSNYQPGDVLLVVFPFAHGGQGKQRPALVVADTGDSDVVLARVTTQVWNTPYDVRLNDWRTAGLLSPSIARLHKLATINKSLVQRTLGTLTSADKVRVGTGLGELCAGW